MMFMYMLGVNSGPRSILSRHFSKALTAAAHPFRRAV